MSELESLIAVSLIVDVRAKKLEIFKKHNISIINLKDMLKEKCESDPAILEAMRNYASKRLTYKINAGDDETFLNETERNYLLEPHKKIVVDGMTFDTLFETILTNPTVYLGKETLNNPLAISSIARQPISNLVTANQHHVLTNKGLILCSSFSHKDSCGNFLKFFYGLLNIPIYHTIEHPAYLDAGDFLASGPDLCFIGAGSNTSYFTVSQLLDTDAYGTERVAVVRDVWDRAAARITLKTVFNIIGDQQCICLDYIMQPEPYKRRLVDEWTKNSSGKYELTLECVDFEGYLKHLEFKIFTVGSDCSQIINLGNSQLITDSENIYTILKSNSEFKGNIELLLSHNAPLIQYESVVIRRETSDRPKSIPNNPVPPAWLVPAHYQGNRSYIQTTDCILMMAPTYFISNDLAILDNFFMHKNQSLSKQRVRELACQEYAQLYTNLAAAGVRIRLFTHQSYHNTPDACFPNNWISTHSETEAGVKTLMLYPMKVPNRRMERRPRVVDAINIKNDYRVISLSDYELHGSYLEGTGALCLDRVNKIAYVNISERAHLHMVQRWAQILNYRVVAFSATDKQKRSIYHTNVMMSVGTKMVVICLESLANAEEKQKVMDTIASTNKEIIDITLEQVDHLCGNVIELRGHRDGKDTSLLAMSTKSFNAFTDQQKTRILANVNEIVHADISTIEDIGGGGVRCTIAELFV